MKPFHVDWISDSVGLTVKTFDTEAEAHHWCAGMCERQSVPGVYVAYQWKSYLGGGGEYRYPVGKYRVGEGMVRLSLADIARVQLEDAPAARRLIAEACEGDPGEAEEAQYLI